MNIYDSHSHTRQGQLVCRTYCSSALPSLDFRRRYGRDRFMFIITPSELLHNPQYIDIIHSYNIERLKDPCTVFFGRHLASTFPTTKKAGLLSGLLSSLLRRRRRQTSAGGGGDGVLDDEDHDGGADADAPHEEGARQVGQLERHVAHAAQLVGAAVLSGRHVRLVPVIVQARLPRVLQPRERGFR